MTSRAEGVQIQYGSYQGIVSHPSCANNRIRWRIQATEVLSSNGLQVLGIKIPTERWVAARLFYLCDFYKIESSDDWLIGLEGEAASGQLGSESSTSSPLTLEKAVREYPAVALEVLAGRLGLDYKTIVAFMAQWEEFKNRPRVGPTKRQLEEQPGEVLSGSSISSEQSESSEETREPATKVARFEGAVEGAFPSTLSKQVPTLPKPIKPRGAESATGPRKQVPRLVSKARVPLEGVPEDMNKGNKGPLYYPSLFSEPSFKVPSVKSLSPRVCWKVPTPSPGAARAAKTSTDEGETVSNTASENELIKQRVRLGAMGTKDQEASE
ncbi:MAG: hypothetical protein M1816_001417 [Peltula sp. TS41687]|nr:MAG: hypothetical protein M1816_001417 [Peltula sp. TS41687]